MWTCPKCQLTLPKVVHPVRCICGHTEYEYHNPGEIDTAEPAWVVWLRRYRKPEDRGVGDTFARLLGRWGERFKKVTAKLGIPCGCSDRQDEWNQRWGY